MENLTIVSYFDMPKNIHSLFTNIDYINAVFNQFGVMRGMYEMIHLNEKYQQWNNMVLLENNNEDIFVYIGGETSCGLGNGWKKEKFADVYLVFIDSMIKCYGHLIDNLSTIFPTMKMKKSMYETDLVLLQKIKTNDKLNRSKFIREKINKPGAGFPDIIVQKQEMYDQAKDTYKDHIFDETNDIEYRISLVKSLTSIKNILADELEKELTNCQAKIPERPAYKKTPLRNGPSKKPRKKKLNKKK